MIDTLYQSLGPWMPWITGASIAMALASMVLIPWLLVRMPEDYFVSDTRLLPARGLSAWLVWGLRNLLSVVLVVAGVIMLVLPGQGLLTILIGIACSTFPGKYRLERALVRRPGVYRAINWVRERYEKPAVIHPDDRKATHE